ncbi:hypothetical protein C5167_030201 [Papaver somniferum]|nr:hypothetical protein C5167_030201 [Papaver somniferum]
MDILQRGGEEQVEVKLLVQMAKIMKVLLTVETRQMEHVLVDTKKLDLYYKRTVDQYESDFVSVAHSLEFQLVLRGLQLWARLYA